MIDSYYSVGEPASAQIKRKRSRFIALVYPVDVEQDVGEILAQIDRRYHDASHRCYAYRLLGETESIARTNDAGEPAGSAGGPILQQLETANLYNVLVVVARYFGGKKLGLGGVIRAYAGATKEVLGVARIVEKHCEVKGEISFPPELGSVVMALIHHFSATVDQVEYNELGRVLVGVVPSQLSAFVRALREKSGAKAKWKEHP